MAVWLKVPPSDLTRIAARNGGEFPLAQVDRIISGEVAVLSGHGTRVMPIWGPVFSQVTRGRAAHHRKTGRKGLREIV
jgi:hypothetical protein